MEEDAEAPEPDNDLADDENDCLSLMESWIGSRGTTSNTKALRFADVDTLLKLAPGSSKLYLAKAAGSWGYSVEREGKSTIKLFKLPDNNSAVYY